MKYFARAGEREYECKLHGDGEALSIEIGGRTYRADLAHIGRAHVYTLLLDGRSYEFSVHAENGTVELSGGAGEFTVEVEDARTHAARAKTAAGRGAGGPTIVRAAMPGIVREVLVADGAAVAKGQALLILEAMKMQNEIRAERAGVVAKVEVASGATVDKGAALVELAPEEG